MCFCFQCRCHQLPTDGRLLLPGRHRSFYLLASRASLEGVSWQKRTRRADGDKKRWQPLDVVAKKWKDLISQMNIMTKCVNNKLPTASLERSSKERSMTPPIAGLIWHMGDGMWLMTGKLIFAVPQAPSTYTRCSSINVEHGRGWCFTLFKQKQRHWREWKCSTKDLCPGWLAKRRTSHNLRPCCSDVSMSISALSMTLMPFWLLLFVHFLRLFCLRLFCGHDQKDIHQFSTPRWRA